MSSSRFTGQVMTGFVLAGVLAGLCGCGKQSGGPAGDDDKDPLERLQGTWAVKKVEGQGAFQAKQLVFEGTILTFDFGGGEGKRARIKIDATPRPPRIHFDNKGGAAGDLRVQRGHAAHLFRAAPRRQGADRVQGRGERAARDPRAGGLGFFPMSVRHRRRADAG